jgi:hypothetical protein
VKYGGQYGLLEETFNKGAHFVLGTTATVTVDKSNVFLAGFLGELEDNQSNIKRCVEEALIYSPNYPIEHIGDWYQYLD